MSEFFTNKKDIVLRKALFLYGNVAGYVSETINNLYDTNKFAHSLINLLGFSTNFIKSLLFDNKIEPMAEAWNCVYYYKYDKKKQFYNEYYSDFLMVTKEDYLIHRFGLYNNIYDTYFNIIMMDSNIKDSMVIMKYNNKYLHRICNKSVHLLSSIEAMAPSSVRFLSIEYTHPKMKTHIFLNLDRGNYQCNNEILSTSFVVRLLEYQSEDYYFDMNYIIKLIDNDINMIEINSKQYVLLKEDKYHILENR